MAFFFFGITHRLCVQGKEWVAAFSGPRLVLHTCLYSRIDLGALSHGWKRNERNTNLLFQLHRYLCATCVWRIWVKSVSCCVCMCARVFVSVCVCLCWMQKYSVHQLFFFLSVTHHGSIVLGFPANHMSGLVMLMPSYINHTGLINDFWVQNQ